MYISDEKFAKLLMIPLILYMLVTFAAMIYLGSCSGKTLYLKHGLVIKMYYGVEKCYLIQ